MSQDIEGIRLIARRIVDRAANDAEFRERVRSDARGTLLAEGIPEDAVPDFLRETDAGGDVEAHAPCGTFSCLVTGCGRTCLITPW